MSCCINLYYLIGGEFDSVFAYACYTLLYIVISGESVGGRAGCFARVQFSWSLGPVLFKWANATNMMKC